MDVALSTLLKIALIWFARVQVGHGPEVPMIRPICCLFAGEIEQTGKHKGHERGSGEI